MDRCLLSKTKETRTKSVKINDYIDVSSGVPQELVLGPLLSAYCKMIAGNIDTSGTVKMYDNACELFD